MKKELSLKNCIFVVLKICLALFLFTALTLLFMPKYIEKNNDGRITAEYYRENTPIDIVFTGSSLVHAGISPMVLYRDFGITAYDRSNSSQTIALSYYTVEEVIKRNKPELIVADVGFIYESPNFIDEGASRKSLDNMKWSTTKYNAIKAMLGEEESFIDYVFPILRFHSRWNDLSGEDLKYWFYKPTVTANGQLLQFDKNEDYLDYNPYKLDENRVADDKNIEYLQKICDLCKQSDVQLLLIKMPCVQGNWSTAINNQIIDLAEKNNVIYKNYTDDFDTFSFDIFEEYVDPQHMNSIGAEKFTNALGEFIKENFDISDRRNNGRIKAVFDKKLQKYEECITNQTLIYNK